MKLHNIILGTGALAALLVSPFISAVAEEFTVTDFESFGPFPLHSPFMTDSLDINKRSFSVGTLDRTPKAISLPTLRKGKVMKGNNSDGPAVRMLSFDFRNDRYANASKEVKGISDYTLYLDGVKTDGERLSLTPGIHNLTIRYIAEGNTPDSISMTLRNDSDAGFAKASGEKRGYTLDDVMHGTRITSTSISPDGKYLLTGYTTTARGGRTTSSCRIISLADGKIVAERAGGLSWMPQGSRYYFERPGVEGREIVAVDAATGAEEVVIPLLPDDSSVSFMPDEKSAILYYWEEGKKEDPGIYQVLEPDDRQPGWRNRVAISMLDLQNGVNTPLIFGNKKTSLLDISPDSRELLLSISESRLEKRPTTVTTILTLDLSTMKADTLVNRDGFVGGAYFSPDGRQIAVTGSPEALGGVGLNLPEGRIPSMIDTQLYLIDRSDKKVTPLTRDFNPNVTEVQWSRADGQIYILAEDRDRVGMFRINPSDGKITAIPLPEELASRFSLPRSGRTLAWYGESASTPQSLYTLDTKTLRSTLLETPKKEQLADVQLGRCEAWDFVNSRGDTICGRFYLPADFDPSKKYPLIVNYYGGCSPTSRNFESRYPHHAYASQGYVVYVVEPSGATGFGQEFSSRHVATAGEGVAQDIIEGTKQFCKEHPYVDDTKIGCIGASYGGFMTQYLQTVTDIFAAAISHAGISDHTSYWGEGYWGYSYSEVSMGDRYPWSDPDLYVKQSPLFRADKVNTPILFLHGDKDVNVPVGESIQMFTALKLLGKPTAFIAVTDQDHHIMDYDKRRKWQDAIYAWFARYLKDDPTWWNEKYE